MRPALVLRPGRQIPRQLLPLADFLGVPGDGGDDPVAPEGKFGVVWSRRVGVEEEECERWVGFWLVGGEGGDGDAGFFCDGAGADERAVGGGFGGEGYGEIVGWVEIRGDEFGW